MDNTSVEHATFTIERRYAAAPEQVFAAWAEPGAKQRWFAEGDGWQDIEHSLDFRVGGRETASGRQAEGPLFGNETVFLDIVAPRRIVFAYAMQLDGKAISASLATVDLRPEGEGTLLVFTEQVTFFEGQDGVASREVGWIWLLGQLGKEVGEAREGAAAEQA